MSRIEKLYNEIFPQNSNIKWFADEETAKAAIKKHFEEVHHEAVAATIMAENKIQFSPPKYID